MGMKILRMFGVYVVLSVFAFMLTAFLEWDWGWFKELPTNSGLRFGVMMISIMLILFSAMIGDMLNDKYGGKR